MKINIIIAFHLKILIIHLKLLINQLITILELNNRIS
jgi:hypothetical protein